MMPWRIYWSPGFLLGQVHKFYHLTLGILATWRVTYFFQAEDGPWDIVVRLRHLSAMAFGERYWTASTV